MLVETRLKLSGIKQTQNKQPAIPRKLKLNKIVKAHLTFSVSGARGNLTHETAVGSTVTGFRVLLGYARTHTHTRAQKTWWQVPCWQRNSQSLLTIMYWEIETVADALKHCIQTCPVPKLLIV